MKFCAGFFLCVVFLFSTVSSAEAPAYLSKFIAIQSKLAVTFSDAVRSCPGVVADEGRAVVTPPPPIATYGLSIPQCKILGEILNGITSPGDRFSVLAEILKRANFENGNLSFYDDHVRRNIGLDKILATLPPDLALESLYVLFRRPDFRRVVDLGPLSPTLVVADQKLRLSLNTLAGKDFRAMAGRDFVHQLFESHEARINLNQSFLEVGTLPELFLVTLSRANFFTTFRSVPHEQRPNPLETTPLALQYLKVQLDFSVNSPLSIAQKWDETSDEIEVWTEYAHLVGAAKILNEAKQLDPEHLIALDSEVQAALTAFEEELRQKKGIGLFRNNFWFVTMQP